MLETKSIDEHIVFADFFDTRMMKGLAYLLSQRLSEGHICLDIEEYNTKNNKEENPYWNKVFELNKIQKNNFVGEGKPILIEGNRAYLNKYYHYETDFLDKIKFLRKQKQTTQKGLQEALDLLFESKQEIDWQLLAVLTAIIEPFSIITGGPGTGKTTTVAKLLAVLFMMDVNTKVRLVGPTGKAAARINESLQLSKEALPVSDVIKEKFTDIQASTVHSMLGTIRNSTKFKHHSEHYLDYDVIIVDESSMIDMDLMAKLMDAVGDKTKVILLGDKHQLSSVGAGSVFGDLCQSLGDEMNCFSEERISFFSAFANVSILKKEKKTGLLSNAVVELQHSYRFKAGKGIGLYSKEVLQGNIPNKNTCAVSPDGKDVVIQKEDYNAIDLYKKIELYKTYIQEDDTLEALQKLNNIRILCVTRKGRWGVSVYNKAVEDYLVEKGLLDIQDTHYHNQPIMVTKNNHSLGLFNGDVGIIRKDESGELKAFFDKKGVLTPVLIGYLTHMETVFAMTIHKSQGSEFREVVVVLPKDEDMPILTRELLYTAVTRAKEAVLVLGEDMVIASTIARKVQRTSGIQLRIGK